MFNYLKLMTVLLWLVLSIPLWSGENEPLSVYLTWRSQPQTSMCIQWISKEDIEEDVIEFQIGEGEDWNKVVDGKHREMPAGLPYIIHSVELLNLKPATAYRFRILSDKENIYRFRTMPADTTLPIRFVVGGDMYNGPVEMLEATNRAAAATDPLFVVIGGDIAYGATGNVFKCENSDKWMDWLRVWKNTMISPEGFLIPIVPAIGNHEVRGGKNGTPKDAEFFYALFPMPGIEGYNALDFGDYMTLIILDSGHTNSIQGPQTEWLQRVLNERRHFSHKFAVYHVPAYPSCRNYHAPLSRLIRKNWVPLFEQFGLHAAFENNDHAYKRSHLIYRGRAQSAGVLYLGDGAWAVENIRKPKTPRQAWYLAKSAASQYFMVVTIEGVHRRFQAFTPKGILFDEVCQ